MLGAYQVLPEEAQVSKTGPALRHNPHSPEVFADGFTGVFSFNGCMRVTFEALRSDYTNPNDSIERVVIGRLVMPIGAAEELAKQILASIENMKNEAELTQSSSIQ